MSKTLTNPLLLGIFIATSFLQACKTDVKAPPPPVAATTDNSLTAAEQAEGWKLLFDGKSLAGWHKYGGAAPGAMWKVAENAIHLDATKTGEGWQADAGGDILTDEIFENFELRLDWKIAPGGNSGIIYHINEDTAKYDYVWHTGPEMQVLDNDKHADGKITKHRAGDLYDLLSSSSEPVKPVGEWNSVRLVSRGGKVEHWMNGAKVVDVQMFENGQPTAAWLALIKGSKFPGIPAPDYGMSARGRISLQDHGDKVWFKNIKLKM